ncbi:50S ribosomal protein L11 methyltransferase [Rhodohalobacter barkolensis]|uniref:Ribosomal protein L11 methyltransferase n=1 Tax=Rhodohalobacter barkolensis TaxID=2053187 RepID=A0A2N0VJN9_9BACT|nr:50S ribosomal protein L11 methyltransferase [Rhodohalobacter barkolensis]PKD44415.1 50S ribosomal protein L11 methyltransferase [Rhodohalobacter barkolensis]
MNYIKLVFKLKDRYQEPFIAELMEMDFYGFEQFDNRLIAYVEKPRYNDSNREMIEQMIGIYPDAEFVETEDLEEQNWNQEWEKSIQPQVIGQFFVRPTWSTVTPSKGQILVEIDPKMAFGTGYHATTRLMLNQLSSIDVSGKKVLDAGTGTGILAIATVKLGAKKAVGFDVDSWSEVNATENALINNVGDQVDIRFGSVEQVKDTEIFDVTLANINRNVILEIIPFLVKHTNIGGDICLTGLLNTDEDIIREVLKIHPVDIVEQTREDEWILFHLKKIQA